MPRPTLLAVLAALTLWFAQSGAGELMAVPPAPPPGLQIPDLDGRAWDLEKLAGQVVLVNFWASWCSPCLEEMPGLARLAERLRGRPFAIVGVNVEEPALRARHIATLLHLDFTNLADTDGSVFRRWGASVLPASYLLDTQGRVRYRGFGPLDWDDAAQASAIESLLPSGSTALPSKPSADPATTRRAP